MIYKPKIYWTCAIGITWAALFIVGYFSHTDMSLAPLLPLMLIGLLAPFGTAVFMIYGMKNRPAARDFEKRLFNLRSIPGRYWLAILLLMPAVVTASTLISVLAGGSADQFSLHPEFFDAGGWSLFITCIGILLAPTFEELGWRSYGMESLVENRTVFSATLIIAVLWTLWHVLLFFIKDYYQRRL